MSYVPVKPSAPPTGRARRILPPLVAHSQSKPKAEPAETKEKSPCAGAKEASPCDDANDANWQSERSTPQELPLAGSPQEEGFYRSEGSAGSAVRKSFSASPEAVEEGPFAMIAKIRRDVLSAVSSLARVAYKLSLVLAQPEAVCKELSDLGFFAVESCDAFVSTVSRDPTCLSRMDGVLLVCVGRDFPPLLRAIDCLDAHEQSPPSLAVLLQPDRLPPEDTSREVADCQAFLEAGADDVMTLFRGQTLTIMRVMTAITWTETTASKVTKLMQEHVSTAKARQGRAFKGIMDKYLWEQLPGHILPYIPFEDEDVIEEVVDNVCTIRPFTLDLELGCGAFGVVFKAKHPDYGVCALKVIPKPAVSSIRQLVCLNTEMCFLMNVSEHPNVLHAHEALHTEGNVIIVMDFVGKLNLHDFIVQFLKDTGETHLPKERVEDICSQAARGVGHLHRWSLCHRDIKPKNFVVTDDGTRICLADFGFACRVMGDNHKLLTWCGSLPFVAPEVLCLRLEEAGQEGYSGLAADVWSLGLNFIEIGCGLFTLEKLLSWVPNFPTDEEELVHDLRLLPMIYNNSRQVPAPRIARVVDQMIALTPEYRCTMQWLMGPDALSLS